jgi:hypothetical protein
VVLGGPANAQSLIMRQHYLQHGATSRASFLTSFPYAQYLRAHRFTDLSQLQHDRLFVWRRFGEGDEFLYRLGEAFLRNYPVDPARHMEHVLIAEQFLAARGAGIHGRNRQPYITIGYYVLNQVAASVQTEHDAGRFDPAAPANKALVDRLARNRIHLAFEESGLSKLWTNVRQGNWGYIWSRARQRVPGLGGRSSGSPAGFRLLNHRSYHRRQDGAYDYQIFNLQNAANQPIGQAVFMRRPRIRAAYAATDVQNQFQRARASGRLVLAATGGFTNNYTQPEGLSVEHGRIVNAVLMPDRDGLVIVQRSGGIRVVNLDRTSIRLPDRSGRGDRQISNPMRSLVSYSALLDWCRQQSATVFQTQLLAFSDTLLLDPQRSSDRKAERRFLVLARHRRTAEVYHIIINLPFPHTLYDGAAGVYHALQARGLYVEAVLNLDTGGQDVFYVYDTRGVNVPDANGIPIRGSRGSHQTTSLLLYTSAP